MSQTTGIGATARRITVRSADGTPLAVWVDGQGPGFVLVHGSPSEHTTFDPLVEALRHDFTTFAMDRRGAGASGDTEPYAIEREFDDVAAVVDAAAARTRRPVAEGPGRRTHAGAGVPFSTGAATSPTGPMPPWSAPSYGTASRRRRQALAEG